MTTYRPRQLSADEARCRPSGTCSGRFQCARFLSAIPQSGASMLDGFAEAQGMFQFAVIAKCKHFIEQAALDAHHPVAEKPAKPWIGSDA